MSETNPMTTATNTIDYVPASPIPSPETQAFWDAAREGRFQVPFCQSCGKAHWYPRHICPHCTSTQVALRASEGVGTVYSFSIMRHGKQPFVLAYVTLNEGPTMLTHLVGQSPDDWRIGERVRVQFLPSDGEYPVPVFARCAT